MDISPSLESTIGNYWNQWLAVHPILAWAIEHPLLGVVLLFLTILALGGLFKALGRGIEQIWIFLLTSPFKLFQPIWSAIRFPKGEATRTRFGRNNTSDVRVNPEPDAERIDRILERLQSLHQEQAMLLQELSRLRGSTISIE